LYSELILATPFLSHSHWTNRH